MHHRLPHFLFSQYLEIYEMQMISLPQTFFPTRDQEIKWRQLNDINTDLCNPKYLWS